MRTRGVMGKRAASQFLSVARTKDWLRIQAGKRQEAVIVGFAAPCGPGRISTHWSLHRVMAVYIGHVGTGFSHAMLEELHDELSKLRRSSSPFNG